MEKHQTKEGIHVLHSEAEFSYNVKKKFLTDMEKIGVTNKIVNVIKSIITFGDISKIIHVTCN